jgi:hypothetical protein
MKFPSVTTRLLITFILLAALTGACSQASSLGQSRAKAALIPGSTQTGAPTDTVTAEPTSITTIAATSTTTSTATSTLTSTPVSAPTNTQTLRPVKSKTPTITPSPTYDFPDVVVNVAAAHCRYGPSKSFLHAADLYEGDHGEVGGRFQYSSWLYVKFDKLNYYCWVSPAVVDLSGDISNILYQELNLQRVGSFDLYEPARNVQAYREGDEVTITWDQVHMTEDDDRGYLIIAWVCQDGAYMWWTQSFEDQYTLSYTVTDDGTCGGLISSGVLYTVEKHGFSEPVTIPWPQAQSQP